MSKATKEAPKAETIENIESALSKTEIFILENKKSLSIILGGIILAIGLYIGFNKLYLEPQPRYSEDIDLVQVNAEPIKETIDHLREVLSWLGEPIVKQKKHNNTLVFRVQPTDVGAGEIHLKVEINCKEHFSVFPMVRVPFSVKNDWFSGQCEVLTYELDELVGTKVRALYQRLKGRDLFDVYTALITGKLDIERVMTAYDRYLRFVASHAPTYKEFVLNMDEKMQNPEFLGDTTGLLRPGLTFEMQPSWEIVRDIIISHLKGQ